MKLLEQAAMRDSISGSVFLCSIPPSGNAAMTKRFLRKNFLLSLRIVWGFVFKGSSNQLIKQLSYLLLGSGVTTNLSLCRELFFSNSNVDDSTLLRYMSRFRDDSKVVVDFKALSNALPSVTCMCEDGKACWLSNKVPYFFFV